VRPIRVLLVDDSTIARRLIGAALAKEPGIELAGTAASGAIALAKIPQMAPDAVVCDVEMPGLDGIATVKKIREIDPMLPVVMFSSLTERGATITLDALAAGANDYALKPSTERGETLETVVKQTLVPKIVAVVGARRASGTPPAKMPVAPRIDAVARPAPVAYTGARLQPEIVVVASSTGGPNALAEVLPTLPGDLPVPVLVVQHMPPVFTRCLAERLDGKSNLRILESAGGERIAAGKIYIAPGGRHLEVCREGDFVTTVLTDAEPENSCRPAADVLFRAAARTYGSAVLGVVLTGMGEDGLKGARAIVEAGGRVIVQSGPTCVVWGMPKAVEEAGLAEYVAPLSEIATAIAQRVARRRSSPGVAEWSR
jgi:two-component system chemotaxis response regulator CheB